MTEEIDFDGWEDVLLYAKNHYDKGNDVIEELKIVQSHITGVPTKYLTNKDTIDMLLYNVFQKAYDQLNFIYILEKFFDRFYFFKLYEENNIENIIHFLLGRIAALSIYETWNMPNKIIELGEIDKELMKKLKQYRNKDSKNKDKYQEVANQNGRTQLF
jgi:hypothetical protein